MSAGKSFYMMFNVTDGGMVEPLEMSKNNLSPDKSIIVMDEEKQRVWLWHGKLRGLVPRRMALRQAESLKGHGYQAGNAIVGRGLSEIVEIDDRKVGREPETTKLNDEFMGLLERKFSSVGNSVFVEGEGKSHAQAPSPKPATPSPRPATEVKPPEPKKDVSPAPSVQPTPTKVEAPKVEKIDTKELDDLKKKLRETESKLTASEQKIKELESKNGNLEGKVKELENKAIEADKKLKDAEAKAASVPAPKENNEYAGASLTDEVKSGAMVMAVLSQFKDIWISKKDGNIIAMEQMDGKIASFSLENGELKLQPESFKDIPDEKKSAIEAKYKELTA